MREHESCDGDAHFHQEEEQQAQLQGQGLVSQSKDISQGSGTHRVELEQTIVFSKSSQASRKAYYKHHEPGYEDDQRYVQYHVVYTVYWGPVSLQFLQQGPHPDREKETADQPK